MNHDLLYQNDALIFIDIVFTLAGLYSKPTRAFVFFATTPQTKEVFDHPHYLAIPAKVIMVKIMLKNK